MQPDHLYISPDIMEHLEEAYGRPTDEIRQAMQSASIKEDTVFIKLNITPLGVSEPTYPLIDGMSSYLLRIAKPHWDILH